MTVEAFIAYLQEKGIVLSQKQIQQFEDYYTLLVEWNEKMNLTAITQKEEVYLKHFLDSLMVIWSTDWQDQVKMIDVGAGAGFPSIPLKILCPQLKVTIIDSLNKRINFLNHVIQSLLLEEIEAVHSRAEEAGQNPLYRGQYDLATARAVAPLNILTEFCVPFVKKGGYFIALKAAKTDNEIEESQKAIKELGAKLENIVTTSLPIEESERTFVIIKKTLDTPKKYPRKPGKPVKQPIK